jgi:excisionase family DNA binding protein
MIMDEELPQPRFLSVPEAAKICGVSRNTLYSWVRQGKLGAYKTPGRTNLIRPSDLVKFMHQNGMFVPASLVEIARNDEKLNQPADLGDLADQQGVAVLVVDDDPISRSLAVRAIHETCVVHQAETGYEALHLLTLHKEIQIVLLDLRMPGQHGSETLAEIHRLRPDVDVVLVTGFADDLSEEILAKGMAQKIVEKPITIPALQAVIAEFTRKKAPAGEKGALAPAVS